MTTSHSNLTPRQLEVWRFLVDFQAEHGWWPTYRDVTRHLGTTGTNGIKNHYLLMLKKKVLLDQADFGGARQVMPTTPVMPIYENRGGKLVQIGQGRVTIVNGQLGHLVKE